jgi:GTP-binding protein
MLVDDITLHLKAGDGGKGAAAFNKIKLNRGPTGGDGGTGGSVYFEGVANINALLQFSGRKDIKAEDGHDGRGQFLDGRKGEHTILKIPIGTTVTNLSTGFKQDMLEVGQRILAAGGGVGGRGNFKFRSSTNITPKEFEFGTQGDEADYKLDLKIIAHVGLVGMPNAGKSSLLNALTSAKSKIANYAFTTLEPNLGAYYGIVIADLPGLIEGAAEGRGLGDKFLRHVERTRSIFHLVSAESEDAVVDYKMIRSELEKYSPALLKKDEFVFLSKMDMVTPAELKAKLAALKKAKIKAVPISVLDDESLEQVKKILNTIKDAK